MSLVGEDVPHECASVFRETSYTPAMDAPRKTPGREGGDSIASPDWRVRLAEVVETMREMSLQTDPQAMRRGF